MNNVVLYLKIYYLCERDSWWFKKSTGTQPSCRGGHLLNYTLLGPSSSPVGKYRQGRGKISILGSFMKKDLPIQLLRTFLIPFTLEGAPSLPVSPLLRRGKVEKFEHRFLRWPALQFPLHRHALWCPSPIRGLFRVGYVPHVGDVGEGRGRMR